jgi:hypothetical protein|tara:strand:+ start:298 stop:441 length:144 start_codon:yes stop_codon:yes gene_type:complete
MYAFNGSPVKEKFPMNIFKKIRRNFLQQQTNVTVYLHHDTKVRVNLR